MLLAGPLLELSGSHMAQFLAAASAFKQGQGSKVSFSAQTLECQEPSSNSHQSGPWSGRGVWGSQSLASTAEFLLS